MGSKKPCSISMCLTVRIANKCNIALIAVRSWLTKVHMLTRCNRMLSKTGIRTIYVVFADISKLSIKMACRLFRWDEVNYESVTIFCCALCIDLCVHNVCIC